MKITKYSIPFLTILLLLVIPVSAHTQDRIDQEIEELKTHARIDPGAVAAPVGRLLLIKKGKDICAITFSEFHRGHDASEGTVFHSGDETLYASYQWICQADGSGDFKKRNTLSGSGKLIRKPLAGIGRLAFQRGNQEIKCGPFKLFWYFPTLVSFSSTLGNCSDSGIELSPTRWVSTQEISASLSSLRWYHCDEQRKTVYVPLDDL